MKTNCRLVIVLVLTVACFLIATCLGQAPLRLGIAGLSHGHVHGLLSRADELPVEIVGIYDPDPALRKRTAERYGLGQSLFFSELTAMLDAVRPEAVAAYNPIARHLEVVEACAPRGIHVMVEKPLTFRADEARRIETLAASHRIRVLTNYETTWYASTAEIDRRVRGQKELGDLRKIVVHDGHQGPREIGVGPEFLAWLTDPALNGAGALVDFGCYGADLALWLLDGRVPDSVTAVTQTMKPDIYPRVDDEATIVLTYPRAQVIIQASWNWPFNRKDIEIYGTRGYLIAPDGQEVRSRLNGNGDAAELRKAPPPRFTNPFSYLQALLSGALGRAADGDLSSLEINVSVARILDAAIRSAREGRTVRLE